MIQPAAALKWNVGIGLCLLLGLALLGASPALAVSPDAPATLVEIATSDTDLIRALAADGFEEVGLGTLKVVDAEAPAGLEARNFFSDRSDQAAFRRGGADREGEASLGGEVPVGEQFRIAGGHRGGLGGCRESEEEGNGTEHEVAMGSG